MVVHAQTYKRMLELLSKQRLINQLCTEVHQEMNRDACIILRELIEQPNDFGFDDDCEANNKKEEN